MFGAAVDAAVVVVVSQVPRHPRQDRASAALADGVAGCDECSYPFPQGLVLLAVAACCGGALVGHAGIHLRRASRRGKRLVTVLLIYPAVMRPALPPIDFHSDQADIAADHRTDRSEWDRENLTRL